MMMAVYERQEAVYLYIYIYTCMHTCAYTNIHSSRHAVEAIRDIQGGEEILADYGERLVAFVIDLFIWLVLLVVLVVTAVFHYLNGGIRFQAPFQRVTPQVKVHLSVLLALMALTKTVQYWLAQYSLVLSRRGAVDGHTGRSGVRLQFDPAGLCRGLRPGRQQGEVRPRFRRCLDQGDERRPLRPALSPPSVSNHGGRRPRARPLFLFRKTKPDQRRRSFGRGTFPESAPSAVKNAERFRGGTTRHAKHSKIAGGRAPSRSVAAS